MATAQSREDLLKSFGAGSTTVTPKKGKDREEGEATVYDVDAIKAFLTATQFTASADEIKGTLIAAIASIPHTEAYLNGEIIIRKFEGIEDTFFSLISAGTLPLDAILYLSLKDSKEGMFKLMGPLSGDVSEISTLASLSRGAFIAWAVQVITRGSNPASSATVGQERPLAKLIKEKALNNAIEYEHQLVTLLTSGVMNKFPSEAILHTDLSVFPPAYYKRMVLSIAGTRGLRYCALSMQFDKNKATDIKTKRAIDLVTSAAERATSTAAGLYLHPMNTTNKHRIGKFTDKLTNAMLHSLSAEGRKQFVEFIVNKDMKAFIKDKNIFGMGQAENFSVMKDKEADFMEITVDSLRLALGVV